MWGVQSDLASPFAHSAWVQFLESGEGCTNDSLSSPDYPLLFSGVRFGSWAERDSYWCAEDGFNDGRVELYQQLLWQVELPQLMHLFVTETDLDSVVTEINISNKIRKWSDSTSLITIDEMFRPLMMSKSRVCPRLCVGLSTCWIKSKVL